MKSQKLKTLHSGLILFFLCFSISPCLAQFGGGTGSEASPYLVATAQHLYNVRDYADAYFLQTGDIFLNVEPYNSGQGWLPIGNQSAPFTGSYDGNSFHIYGLYINQPEGKNLGLFGYTNSAVLKNITLNNVNISGKDYTGSLVGSVNGGFIQSCSCDGTITGVSVTGGLVGALELSCHLEKCSVNCVVNGQFSTGGLCGYSKGASEIYTSYSKGTVIGNNATGGLVGMQGNSTISQSFSASAVQGNWGAGGLLGVNDTQSLVAYCYSIGVVTGNSNTGGLIGRNVVSQTLSSYWNLESSGQIISAGGIGRTTDEMTYPYAANTYENWNLTAIWQPDTEYFVNAGYPYLQWMYPCPPIYHLSYQIENYSVILQWSPPYVSSYTGFNIYKNGVLYTTVTDSFFIDSDVYHGEQYTYQVSVIYEGGESTLSEQVSFYVYFPPLPANCVFPLNGATEMEILPLLQWSPDAHHNYPLPDGYVLEVWALSGNLVVNEDVGNVTSYQITNPLDYETDYYWKVTPYTWGEENTYLYAENVPNWYFTTQEQIIKPVNLTATIENWKNVQLNWNLGEPNWLYWDSGYLYTSIGYIDSPHVWDVACKFASSDLLSHTGKYITQVKFTPCEASSNYRIRIWSGDDNNIGPSVLLVDQPLQTNDLVMNDWNTVSLLTPVPIQPATAYWIGYNIDQVLYPTYPAGADEGPVVPGKGAIIYHNSTWMELMEANSELNYNFCIRAYVQSGSRELTQLSLLNIPVTPNQEKTTDPGTLSASTNPPQIPSRSLQNFNIYRNGTLIGNSYIPSYYDENLSQGEYTYYVTALYDNAESEPSNTAGVTIAYIFPPQNVYAALIDSMLQLSWQPSVSALEQGYVLYRLQEGQENEPYLWEQIGYTTDEFTFFDAAWQYLPAGYYKWAIKAYYDYDNYSEPAFSNVIYKVVNLIPDDNFRIAINEALGQPADYIPTIADLNGLTGTLSANERNIISIEGAQYLTNLQWLFLNHNRISDLSPLAGLTNLYHLYLRSNQISNLSPLAGLTNLQELYLSYNQISDPSPLAGLTNLQVLYLQYNQISDLSPLAGLTNLQDLWLSDNQISDLSPLTGLTNLQELYLGYNQISDLSPLLGLTNLYNLYLENNQISDLSPLAGLTNLNYLFLDYNQISDLRPLAGLTSLYSLFIENNQISDLSPLAGLTNLHYLYLNYNQISELSPLAGLTNLRELYLSSNQISDLSPLAGLTNLRYLDLSCNPISYESMLLSQSWTLPWSTDEYNPLSPCYPDPSRNATNVLVNYPLSWQGNYDNSQDVFYEVWLGISPDSLFSQGLETQMANVTEHLYSFTPMLEPLTQYYWRIRAIAPTDTIWSGMWSFTTGEEFYQPIISVTPTIIYAELTTEETSQTEITIVNDGTAPLIWNSNIVLTRAEQKTGTNAYLTKENNTERELNTKIENIEANSIRDKDINREGTSPIPEINLFPSSGTIEPNSSVTCFLYFIPGDSLGTYNYELQLSSNDPVSPLITVPLEYVVTSPIAYIPDVNFRMAINVALGQPSDYQPTIADLNGLTEILYAYDRNIISIEGAQYLTNLQYLYLFFNQISDLSPLEGLTNLQNLYLDGNQISDLSPLAGLTNLQLLALDENQISDLSPLTGLNNLNVLSLYNNQISDLSPLDGLTNLNDLCLEYNQISDLSPLDGLTNLQQLSLQYNQISDISPLAGLTNLLFLDLGGNQISDLSPLEGLTNLYSLYLENNQISDLSPLSGLTNLGILNLDDNPFSYESMQLSHHWSLPWSTDEYNPLSPCYPDPSRNATNVLVNYPLSWQGNYDNSQDVFYEVWLGISPDSLFSQGLETQMVNVTEHLYSFTPMLEPLTQYYWRIRAIAPADTIWSGMWSFTTGEEFYQPIISVTPTSIYADLTTAETSQAEITIANYGTAPLIWNSNIVLTRAEQKTGTNAYLTKENNTESELHAKIENIDANSIRDKDRNREETSPMPEINLSPSSGTIEPNSSVTCILNFIPGDSLGIYNYELQLLSNDPVSPLVTVPLEYVVTSPIAYIPDDNFRMAINEALGQPAEYQPTIADLNGLTGTLSAYQRNIISIEGAQYLTNLQDLHLQNNQISDLSPLAGLTHLLWLDLDDNQISDISPLAGLTNLQDLWLSHNQISDLSPLAGLTNLHYLNLDNNQISDLSPLAELSNLQGLNLWSNQISNLSPLASMTNLNYLILEYNQISDLSPLAGLTYLQNLDLGLNLISDLSTLAGLNNLKDLYLYNNQISDLSPLAGLSNLQYLRLNYNQISDLSPLVGLTNLQGLDLSYNQISDLSPLLGLTHLANLWLDGNPISYESMLLSQSWTLPWSTNEYNPLSPCYPVPSRNATNVLVNYPLSWQGNYDHSQDVFYEVWLGISPDSLFSQGLETQMVNATEHLYSFTPMLEPLTQYYWRIRAIAPTDTIWSGIWSFTTGEEFYQPIISVTPTNIYAELTTAETSQRQITIANQGTAPLIWNSNIVLTRAEQKTGTNAYLTKENNTERELHSKIENIDANSIRDKDRNREGTSPMLEINLSPSSGTIEPDSSVICILNFIPGDSLGTYNYELQISSNDPVSPLITVPLEYIVTSPIAYIPDINFRMAINEELGQPSDYQPTIADLNGLTGILYAHDRYIISIVGAQYLTNLQELYLNNNQISDLSPLAGLTNLKRLYLSSNQISDLSPLMGLNNLKWLHLDNNQISDLSPLAGLTNLQLLTLGENQISDLSPLAGLTNLYSLNISVNQISDLSPLAMLTNLDHLEIFNNQLSDLSPLAGLNTLQGLLLQNNQISDISPLAGITNLQVLYLNYNQISDLNPLVDLTNLQNLRFDYNQISDLSPLAGLTNLQWLYFANNQISDLGPLAGLINLQVLVLWNNPISYESMLLSQSWSLPCHISTYNSLSPCYPDPSRNATNVLVNYPLSWQGNYDHSQDVFYEVWLGISPDSLFYQGLETQMVNVTEHLYSFSPMLEPLTHYYWRIRAIAPTDTIWSGMWSFTTGEEFYQPIISVTPTSIYADLTTAETSQAEITIANYGTAPLIWNSNIVLTRAEQKTGTNAYLTKENNTERELNAKIENIDANSKRDKDMNREGTSPMPEINLSPSSGTIEPNSSVTCILNFIPGDSLGTYNYELQLSSNDPSSPLITVPLEYVVTSPIAYIPDDNFRMAINEALGQPAEYQPTIADLNGLTGTLSAYQRNIISIEGAQYLINLQELHLYLNQISDLSPLAELANLQVLILGGNQIIDLSPLVRLTNLQKLYLENNQISDLSPLADLTILQWLDLYNNQIIDLSPLEGLTNMQWLILHYNQISDLSPLAGLTNLQVLWLDENQISDLSPLAGLNNLWSLSIYGNPISYESMLLSQSWSLPWHISTYNPLSPCYPDPSRNATNVLVNYPLSWQGNYDNSQDVSYEVWLGVSPDSLFYQGLETQMVNVTEHLYSFTPMLEPLTQYYWRIRAIAPTDTIWSGMWSFTTGEEFYQPIISVTPTSIYAVLTTAETSQRQITIANQGTAPLIWNSNIVLTRAEQKTGTNAYLTKENNTERELNAKIENIDANSIRDKDMNREGTSPMPEINLSPSSGTIEPNSSVICILNFIPGDSLGTYNYELQLSSNDPASPLITVPVEYVVTSPIAYIPDDNFRMAINGKLGQPSDYQPTIADLQGIMGSLDAAYRSISSIVGAQYLTNLQELLLQVNQISDLSPLAGLTNMQWLYLYTNQISDLSPLAELTNLQVLRLYNNQISNLNPLEWLTNLQFLYIDNNQINDLSPLAGLTNLQKLWLNNNQICDLSPLVDLTNLQELELENNPISYESMLLSQSWSLPCSTNEYNPLSPCYPVPNRNANNVLVNYPLSWQGNYNDSQDVFYEVWLGISPDSLVYQGFETQMVNITQHLYSFTPMLEPLTQYYWRIRAIAPSDTIWSGMWSFTTGEEFYQPIISVAPTNIYDELTTAETSQIAITIANNGTSPLIWNGNIVLTRAEQKTGTNVYLTKENNIERELHPKIENTAENSIRYKDMDREGTSQMPEINLSPSFGTIEPNSSVICILNFIPGDSLGTYNYELQLSSNDPISPLITVPVEYVVTSPIAYIPDDNFRMAINEALGQPSEYQPTIADLNGLNGTLYAYERNITSIEGAQYLTNIQDIQLSWNQINNISPLAGLTNLQGIYIYSNHINNISPLAGLYNLKCLHLGYNSISDISPLSGLINLESLTLTGNLISNLIPLSQLIHLNELFIGVTYRINDLSPLAALTNLKRLGLWANQICDISPLAGLNNLIELDISYNQIININSLTGMINLEHIQLEYNNINDLTSLTNLNKLQVIVAYNNQISDISPLEGLTNLRYLDLGGNPISYESMLLSHHWSLPWSTDEYNPLSPCYPDPSRNATNALVNYPLSWQGNYDNSQNVFYEVWLGFSSDNLSYIGSGNHISGTQYSFTVALQSDTQYYWRIKAVSLAGGEIWSGMWSFTTGSYGAGNMSMLEPVSVTLAINALQNEVRLSWQRRRDDESYYVYWSENPYAEFPEGWNGPVNVTETNYTDTLTDKCFYRVFAVPSIRGETENKQNTKQRANMPGRGE